MGYRDENEVIGNAVREGDSATLFKVACYMRYALRMSYAEVYERIDSIEPIDRGRFVAEMVLEEGRARL